MITGGNTRLKSGYQCGGALCCTLVPQHAVLWQALWCDAAWVLSTPQVFQAPIMSRQNTFMRRSGTHLCQRIPQTPTASKRRQHRCQKPGCQTSLRFEEYITDSPFMRYQPAILQKQASGWLQTWWHGKRNLRAWRQSVHTERRARRYAKKRVVLKCHQPPTKLVVQVEVNGPAAGQHVQQGSSTKCNVVPVAGVNSEPAGVENNAKRNHLHSEVNDVRPASATSCQ